MTSAEQTAFGIRILGHELEVVLSAPESKSFASS